MPRQVTKQSNNSWTIYDEKKYLDGLGTHAKESSSTISRRQLLVNYLAYMENRVAAAWHEAAIAYAKKLLAKKWEGS